MNRKQLAPIIEAVAERSHDREYIGRVITQVIKDTPDIKPGWALNLTKLLTLCTDKPVKGSPFTVFAEGNSKLPFLSFSGLPGVQFCPGAGDCAQWCYSFSSWRYPAAFCRQVQNTLLLSTDDGRLHILNELDAQLRRAKYRDIERVDFRLYVDGDFRNVSDIHFWMQALHNRPKLAAYGYSKSFHQLLGYDVAWPHEWPSNYVLNVSSGHKHSAEVVAAVEALPITRGHFVAVPMAKTARHSDHGDRDHQKALRETYGRKAFTCPGECGDCTPSGHACGSDRFKGVDIIIAAH